jgi:cell division transport system ATP-binding protein
MIRLHDVAKEYTQSRVALSHVTFQVKRGEFVFLIGPSGSGKTTILKLLYMEEKPSHGDVWVSGVHANTARRKEISQLRRKLGIVFQDFRLLEDRTAEQNVAFALEVTGAPKSAISQRVTRVLTQVGLASKATHLPRQLSGGEQQRVAIARALVNDPYFLLADEPTGNLDSKTGAEIMSLFARLHEGGNTIVLVTHEADVAAYAHRTISLRDGQIEKDVRSDTHVAQLR